MPFVVFGTTGDDALTLRLGKAKLELDIPLAKLSAAWRTGFTKVVE